VAAELLTGTVYLLMVAFGLGAGALAAHAGASTALQMVAAALVGGGGLAILIARRRQAPSARTQRSVNLDIGETVLVEHWNTDGTSQVRYRGTTWTVVHRPDTAAAPGTHRVVELIGNRLLVEPV
jgi:membrane protein implicated in regulation of membrane protease activity